MDILSRLLAAQCCAYGLTDEYKMVCTEGQSVRSGGAARGANNRSGPRMEDTLSAGRCSVELPNAPRHCSTWLRSCWLCGRGRCEGRVQIGAIYSILDRGAPVRSRAARTAPLVAAGSAAEPGA